MKNPHSNYHSLLDLICFTETSIDLHAILFMAGNSFEGWKEAEVSQTFLSFLQVFLPPSDHKTYYLSVICSFLGLLT